MENTLIAEAQKEKRTFELDYVLSHLAQAHAFVSFIEHTVDTGGYDADYRLPPIPRYGLSELLAVIREHLEAIRKNCELIEE